MEPTRTGPAAAAGAPSSSSPIQLIACGTILRRGPRRRRDRGRYRYDLRRGPRRRLDRRGKIQVPRRGVAATGAAPNAREQEDRGAADLREEEARRFEVFRIVRHSERVAPGRAALGDRRRVLLHASNRVAVEPEVAPAPTRPRRDEALIRSSILVRSARSVGLGTSTSRPAAAPRSHPEDRATFGPLSCWRRQAAATFGPLSCWRRQAAFGPLSRWRRQAAATFG